MISLLQNENYHKYLRQGNFHTAHFLWKFHKIFLGGSLQEGPEKGGSHGFVNFFGKIPSKSALGKRRHNPPATAPEGHYARGYTAPKRSLKDVQNR